MIKTNEKISKSLTSKEVAYILNIKPRVLMKMRKLGDKRIPWKGEGKSIMYKLEDVKKFIEICKIT
ncbi:helix-turn-helix domain-containing protein [Colwellia sp. MSW7]|uniref:Helix-turn-helix domain-containing protein n=1 Tax=Colwellia maritima TaxID=2912588 RepID=A0ABS9WZQ7_9GAMM|nr:helix-turn-helix domain-containing protein [Colwellia maritima]MCI2283017.1 helix-turn-helix domain-containing protein [Colwellia maritima]